MARELHHGLEYDDDDYLPPVHTGAGSSRALPRMLVIVGGAILVVAVATGMFFLRSREAARHARLEADRRDKEAVLARQQGAVSIRPMGPGAIIPEEPTGPNWEKLVGSWSRPFDPNEEIPFPVQFDIQPDRIARLTYHEGGKPPIDQDAKVQVLSEEGNSIRLALQPLMRQYIAGQALYHLTIQSNDTLVLEVAGKQLVFHRQR